MVELKPCPFCGGEAKRFTIGEDEPNNAGGDCIGCTKCGASSHVEFGRKENLVSCWNARARPSLSDEDVERVRDWTPSAAMLTLNLADHPPAVRSSAGKGIEHASWMLGEIVAGRIEGRKAHRWLGYAQAILVEAEWLKLDEAKNANKEASEALHISTDSGVG